MGEGADSQERRARDISHSQLLDQVTARFVDLQKHMDTRFDANDRRHETAERAREEQGRSLTDLVAAVARIEGERAGEKSAHQEIQPPASVATKEALDLTRWQKIGIWVGLAGASVAILGGLTSAVEKLAWVAKALAIALATSPPPPHP